MTPPAPLLRAIAVAAACQLWATAALAQAPQGPTTTELRIGAFLPKGFRVVGEASADFNHDGLADLVVVLGNENDPADDATCSLLVLLARPAGGWTLSARAKIDCSTDRGPHGSGFGEVTAHRDTFLVRTFENLDGDDVRFQLRGGRWFMIGAKSSWFTTGGPPGLSEDPLMCFVQKMEAGETCNEHEVDTNFLTGDQIESSVVDTEREKVVRRKIPVGPLRPMGEWIPGR